MERERDGTMCCTIEYRADEESGEVGLLSEVEPVWDLWSVRVAGPGRSPIASHMDRRYATDGKGLEEGMGGRGLG